MFLCSTKNWIASVGVIKNTLHPFFKFPSACWPTCIWMLQVLILSGRTEFELISHALCISLGFSPWVGEQDEYGASLSPLKEWPGCVWEVRDLPVGRVEAKPCMDVILPSSPKQKSLQRVFPFYSCPKHLFLVPTDKSPPPTAACCLL